jgi:hypothetical protein
MPEGKPAGVPCIHLTDDYLCALFNSPSRPKVCINFGAEKIICGNSRDDAMETLEAMEGMHL